MTTLIPKYDQGGTGAINRPINQKLAEVVSVADFGAKCDWNGTTGTDDSTAVQAAVDYCITNKKDLYIPSKCLLGSTIYINRQVDTFDAYGMFTISGGGFVVNTDIAMFDTTLHSNYPTSDDPTSPYYYFPGSQNIQFVGVTFEGSTLVGSKYVMGSGRILRLVFTQCSFYWIKLVSTGDINLGTAGLQEFTQQWYLVNCSIRQWDGIFYRSVYIIYQLCVSDCQVEGGGGFIEAGSIAGGAITNNVIEGDIYALRVIGAVQGVTITGNYMEGNTAYDIKVFGDVLGTIFAGNHLIPYIATPTCIWAETGIVQGLNSYGNYCTGLMHQIPSGTTTDQFITRDYCPTPVTPVPVAPANYYVTATDARVVAVPTTLNFMSINLGTTGSAALIDIVATGTIPGVAFVSQVSKLAVTRVGTGAISITTLSSTTASAYIDWIVSGDTVVLRYIASGVLSNKYATSVAIHGLSGSGDAVVYPTITIL
jgi:hypothetical protein